VRGDVEIGGGDGIFEVLRLVLELNDTAAEKVAEIG
jgi:hypothetical protein